MKEALTLVSRKFVTDGRRYTDIYVADTGCMVLPRADINLKRAVRKLNHTLLGHGSARRKHNYGENSRVDTYSVHCALYPAGTFAVALASMPYGPVRSAAE